jgi:hypothetical protein
MKKIIVLTFFFLSYRLSANFIQEDGSFEWGGYWWIPVLILLWWFSQYSDKDKKK